MTEDASNSRRHVQHVMQAVGFMALLTLAVGAVLTATGAFAGGLAASSVKPADVAYAPMDTDTPAPTSTPNPCDPVWSVVSSPNVGTSSNVLNGVAMVSANDVWAVGYYSGGTLIEHWDGTSWSVVPNPNGSSFSNLLYGVAAGSANDVWAVGCYNCGGASRTLVEHWDGTSWSVVPSPNPGTGLNFLYGVAAVSATDVWAAGFWVNSSGPYHTLVEHWNGTSWSVMSSPSPYPYPGAFLNGITAVSANDVWAVGYYNVDPGPSHTLVEHWNGTAWSVVSSPNVGTHENSLSKVAAVSANDVWAVGYYDEFGSGFRRTLVEHWDGIQWSVVPSPSIGLANNELLGVAAISTNDVWAVGYYPDTRTLTLVEHWDGTSWSVVSSPNPGTGNNYLYGVAVVSATDVWAVGSSANGSGVNQTLVEHYATLCGTPTSTPTNTFTPTNTPTSTATSTPTNTPTPCPSCTTINGHLTWQGVAAANRPSVPGTLQLCVSGSTQTFNFTTDTSGNFTVTTVLPDGTYHWRTKGGRQISNSSPADGADLVVTNGYAMQEFGQQRGGDSNSDNIVQSRDFSDIKHQFGLGGIRSSDFDYNNVVNAQDYNILKTHFGQAGRALTCP